MCLTIKTFNDVDKVADKDIICYKWVIKHCGAYRAPFMDNVIHVDCNAAYYPSNPDKSAMFDFANFIAGEGYIHVFSKPQLWIMQLQNNELWKCIIPKGTMYCEGIACDEESYAAKKIVFLNKMSLTDLEVKQKIKKGIRSKIVSFFNSLKNKFFKK